MLFMNVCRNWRGPFDITVITSGTALIARLARTWEKLNEQRALIKLFLTRKSSIAQTPLARLMRN
jgi:hypothetical protein